MTARRLARGGAAGVAASLALFAWLHLAPPSSRLDWSSRTISQYALLDNGWIFDAATLLLAAGSAAILGALLRGGVLRPASGATAALALWVVGLVAVVWFEKHNWAVGPSTSGDIHRVASLVAFLSLPTAALLAARPWLRSRVAARVVALAGAISFLCFTPILYALVSEPWTGVRWWRAIPLGGVERALGLAEVATVLLLAWWAARAPDRVGARAEAAAVADRRRAPSWSSTMPDALFAHPRGASR
jgi:uncharacterized protein DUF998